MHGTYLAGIERALRQLTLENWLTLANPLGDRVSELFNRQLKRPAPSGFYQVLAGRSRNDKTDLTVSVARNHG
jgi:hypothetical protein